MLHLVRTSGWRTGLLHAIVRAPPSARRLSVAVRGGEKSISQAQKDSLLYPGDVTPVVAGGCAFFAP
jgi:hypothetical protein